MLKATTCLQPVSVSFARGRAEVLTFLLIIFSLSSCIKNPTTPVNSDLKAKFNYQPGSYWIYKDSISGQVDSFNVISNTDQNTNVLYESIFIYFSRHNVTYDTDTAIVRCMLSRNYFQTYALGAVVTYPFTTTTGSLPTGATVLSTGGTYTVNGEVFNDVAVITSRVQLNYLYTDTFYINADAGIIKINEHWDVDTPILHRVWELQRRNILR